MYIFAYIYVTSEIQTTPVLILVVLYSDTISLNQLNGSVVLYSDTISLNQLNGSVVLYSDTISLNQLNGSVYAAQLLCFMSFTFSLKNRSANCLFCQIVGSIKWIFKNVLKEISCIEQFKTFRFFHSFFKNNIFSVLQVIRPSFFLLFTKNIVCSQTFSFCTVKRCLSLVVDLLCDFS